MEGGRKKKHLFIIYSAQLPSLFLCSDEILLPRGQQKKKSGLEMILPKKKRERSSRVV